MELRSVDDLVLVKRKKSGTDFHAKEKDSWKDIGPGTAAVVLAQEESRDDEEVT